jgi:hypothetical protein
MIKQVSLFMLLAVLFADCKKGENDPFFTIFTRKHRLTGTWKITEFERRFGDTTQSFDGTAIIQIAGSEEARLPATFEYIFDKKGKYNISERITYPEGYFGAKTPAITRLYSEEGIWNFTGGAGDTKSKSYLLLQPEIINARIEGSSEVSVTTYQNPMSGKTYYLDMLRNKSMRWKYEEVSSTPFGKEVQTGTVDFEKTD